jgi:hypothetical protein
MPRKANPTGFGSDWQTLREQLLPKLNAALEAHGSDYRVESARDLHRIYAGHWQRSAGAGSWFADAKLPGTESHLQLISWDTMRDCLRFGFTLDRGVVDLEVNACGSSRVRRTQGSAQVRNVRSAPGT